jgi:leucyl aminopeptidase
VDFSIKNIDEKTPISSLNVECIVIGVYEDKRLSPQAKALNTFGQVTDALHSGDISGKLNSSLLLRDVPGVAASRILLVGLGKDEDGKIDHRSISKTITCIGRTIATLGSKINLLALPFNDIKDRDLKWAIRNSILVLRDNSYDPEILKSKKETIFSQDKEVIFLTTISERIDAEESVFQGIALANGIDLAKDLGNLPGNICTPTYLADIAQDIARDFQLSAEILGRKELNSLEMNSFLSVSHGSSEEPKFIIVKYLGSDTEDAPIVLVGKGITFDSGGLSLKNSTNMDEMKYDMCGAGAVLGTIRAIAELKLKLNVICVIPASENMPSGTATKPGDIVTSMSGQTIEILNTDAEGRLVLCDALTYVERFKPSIVIDIATLTGACVVSLGHHNSGLFTRHDEAHDALAEELLTAGRIIGDTAWRMPVEDGYQEQLKSNFADMANIGGPAGGSITAACFLERYTKKYTWAHLDIAGTAWKTGVDKGATGRPVALLTNFLIKRVEQGNKF